LIRVLPVAHRDLRVPIRLQLPQPRIRSTQPGGIIGHARRLGTGRTTPQRAVAGT
jgi:hypothetical protein